MSDMDRDFRLGDVVYFFGYSKKGLNLYRGRIDGMRYKRAFLRKKIFLFFDEDYEVELSRIFKTKEDALKHLENQIKAWKEEN